MQQESGQDEEAGQDSDQPRPDRDRRIRAGVRRRRYYLIRNPEAAGWDYPRRYRFASLAFRARYRTPDPQLEWEVRALRTAVSAQPLRRSALLAAVGARHWDPGRFRVALRTGLYRGDLIYLGRGWIGAGLPAVVDHGSADGHYVPEPFGTAAAPGGAELPATSAPARGEAPSGEPPGASTDE